MFAEGSSTHVRCAEEDCFNRKVQDTIRHGGFELMFRSYAPAYLHKQQSAKIADQVDLRLVHL